MKSIKLSQWAKNNDMSYNGAYQLFLKNQLPNSYRLVSGTIMVRENIQPLRAEYTAVYCRVSTPKQKNDLLRQVEFVETFCAAKGWVINKIYKEVASGLNDDRKQLNLLLDNKNITRVVISEKDRLTRFGFNYIMKILNNNNCEIVVINNVKTDSDDLMQDFISIITSMAARVYGLRRHKKHVEQIITSLDTNE
jgi:predicted site-specific integrase-resolvase